MAGAPNLLQLTAKLYKSIIDDVVMNVKEAFLDEGIDDSVLNELKTVWETKVLATKAVETLNPQPFQSPPSVPPSPAASSPILNQEYAAATNSNVSAPLAVTTSIPVIRNVLPQASVLVRSAAIPTGTIILPSQTLARGPAPSGFVTVPLSVGSGGTTLRMVNPQQFASYRIVNVGPSVAPSTVVVPAPPSLQVLPSALIAQPPPTDVSNPPQLDGTASAIPKKSKGKQKKEQVVFQCDGPPGIMDDDDDDLLAVDDDLPAEDDDDDEENDDFVGFVDEEGALNSEDDDLVNENVDLFEADDVIVCQYEKVTRQKNKWKFILKDGIINLRHKDYVFNKAVGESEF